MRAARIDRTLAALADPHRRRLIELLGERPRRAGELAAALGLPAPALSRHLRTLKAGGLVAETHPRFDARVRIYSLRPKPMADLRAWLAETENLWSGQLAAFKAHLEARRMTSRVLVSLRVAAAPKRAFDVFTREIAAWWRPNMLFRFTPRSPGVLAFEPQLGGRFTETLANGKVFEIGRITAWEPGSRLAFTWRQASFSPGQITQVEVRFEAVGEETRVTVEHRGWECVPREHVARHGFPDGVFLQRHGEWWQDLLRSLRMQIGGRRAAD